MVEHSLDDQGEHHRHAHDTLPMGGLDTEGVAVVVEVVAYGGYQVVGTVAADTALEVESLVQSVLLNEAIIKRMHSLQSRVQRFEGTRERSMK